MSATESYLFTFVPGGTVYCTSFSDYFIEFNAFRDIKNSYFDYSRTILARFVN